MKVEIKECEICNKSFKGEDYWQDDMLCCEDCFNDALNKADLDYERYKEERILNSDGVTRW
jgi:hypothetical protein